MHWICQCAKGKYLVKLLKLWKQKWPEAFNKFQPFQPCFSWMYNGFDFMHIMLTFFEAEIIRKISSEFRVPDKPKICCSFKNLSGEWRAVNVKKLTAKVSKKQQIIGLNKGQRALARGLRLQQRRPSLQGLRGLQELQILLRTTENHNVFAHPQNAPRVSKVLCRPVETAAEIKFITEQKQKNLILIYTSHEILIFRWITFMKSCLGWAAFGTFGRVATTKAFFCFPIELLNVTASNSCRPFVWFWCQIPICRTFSRFTSSFTTETVKSDEGRSVWPDLHDYRLLTTQASTRK